MINKFLNQIMKKNLNKNKYKNIRQYNKKSSFRKKFRRICKNHNYKIKIEIYNKDNLKTNIGQIYNNKQIRGICTFNNQNKPKENRFNL